jgi:hypothetical protein
MTFFFQDLLSKKNSESEGLFILRSKWQQLLQGAVFKLQGEFFVSKKEVKEILEALEDLVSYGSFFTCDLLRNLFIFYPKDSVKSYSRHCLSAKNRRVFSLKLVHVYEKFHVRIFRKQEGFWMCYDGMEVRSEPVPWKDVYLLVYESEPSIKEK